MAENMVKVLVLKKRKDFIRAAKGLKMVSSSLIVQAAHSLSSAYRTADNDCCFVGYTVTKKIGKAHLRNRVKRRLRAAVRAIMPKTAKGQTDYVLIGRYNTADTDFTKLKEELKTAVSRLNKMLKKESAHEKAADLAD